jgi:hypothetical protein
MYGGPSTMPSKHIFNNAVLKAIDYTMLATKKSTCCEPYDCMCHEQCYTTIITADGVFEDKCNLCTDVEAAFMEVMRYCRKRNVDIHKVWQAENEWTKQDRADYYKHTMYNDNAPTHWSDGGKYED